MRKALSRTFEVAVGFLFLAGALAGLFLQLKSIVGL